MQAAPVFGDRAATFERAVAAIAAVAGRGLVLPERFVFVVGPLHEACGSAWPRLIWRASAWRAAASTWRATLADRLDERLGRAASLADDRSFIESRTMFFLATANSAGAPDCSYQGGDAGFVRATAADELAFPSYDGNGMFRSFGNVAVNGAVALLFIDFGCPNRLRVNGLATLHFDDPLRQTFSGAQVIVRVRARRIFPNCPSYIHRLRLEEPSPYVSRPGQVAPVPRWKCMDDFATCSRAGERTVPVKTGPCSTCAGTDPAPGRR